MKNILNTTIQTLFFATPFILVAVVVIYSVLNNTIY